jgi:putative salt-induced outer membrane protein YdiY
MNLLLNVGPGLQQRELTTGIGNETQPQWLTQATYNLCINEVLTFYEQLQNTATATNNATYSISQINLLVGNGFSIGINYQITYNTQAPQGKSPTTITSFQVNYGIY